MLLAGLILSASITTAKAGQDWVLICDTISNFALLTAAGREHGKSAAEAARVAAEQLGSPSILTPKIMDEVTRQVYRTPLQRLEVEAENLRELCLAPLPSENVVTIHPDLPIAALRPIKLNTGTNSISTSQGDLEITLTWQDNGHGHGQDVFSIRMKGSSEPISIENELSISDDPADDYNMRRSVRFAEGEVGGTPGVFALVADREGGDLATRTIYAIYRLVRDAHRYKFVLLHERVLPARYCNADAALTAASGLPLRASYKGPATQTGCLRSLSVE